MSIPPQTPDDKPSPRRIQRQRTKGWRMPEGAVYVGRPSRWGNPASVSAFGSPAAAVAWYEEFAAISSSLRESAREVLAGRDLACWCPLDQPCHADVLLGIANGGAV